MATLLFIVPGLTKPKDVTIPEDIIGQEFSEVEDELEALNLVVEREDMPHDEIEEGKVVKTNPRPGRTIKEGQTITVYVSEGKAKDMFGDYVGRQIGDVERLLEEKGYKPPQIYEVFSDEPAGVIIKRNSARSWR